MTNDTATPQTISERFPNATPRPWVADGTCIEHFEAPMKPDIAACSTGSVMSLPPIGPEAEANAALLAYTANHYEALEASHARLIRALADVAKSAHAALGHGGFSIEKCLRPACVTASAAIECAKGVTT